MGDLPVHDQTANSERCEDRLFNLMKSEKEHVDEQISSFMGIQMKILAFLFPALGLATGWLFGDGKGTLGLWEQGLVLLIVVLTSCFGILLSIAAYCVAMEYEHYKQAALVPRFNQLLRLEQKSLFGREEWGKGPASTVLVLSLTIFWLLIFSVIAMLLVRAHEFMSRSGAHSLKSFWAVAAFVFASMAVVVVAFIAMLPGIKARD